MNILIRTLFGPSRFGALLIGFLRFVTVAYLLFLAPAGVLTLRGND